MQVTSDNSNNNTINDNNESERWRSDVKWQQYSTLNIHFAVLYQSYTISKVRNDKKKKKKLFEQIVKEKRTSFKHYKNEREIKQTSANTSLVL